ncbi:hypothetical protein [Actinacidiphila oryziradicis]|uniref:Transcriptional regulator n=1 Tax=Actinacidiphila oryziradicis TaxID=2571141 RepID=A0A4U0SKE3_9ACTN|nr:hypothetical protein [Actinacidiphila oryziradicis]TKA10076.1 hypothetical protein FCI23_19340 [Actinacidiphila oryziradicis]
MVDAVARRVGNMSARREKAWRWEHRGVVPDRETQEALADELGVPHDTLDVLPWPAWLPAGERDELRSPWTREGCVAALGATAGAALLDQRGFLVSGEGSAVAVAEEWLALSPAADTWFTDTGAPDSGGEVEAGVVEGLEQRLPALRRMARALGGGRVRTVVDAELQLVSDLIARSSGPGAGAGSGPTGRRLFAVAAELARMAGWASLDTCYQAAAERYLLTGLSAAHAAGDRALGANILKSLSLQYLDADRPAEALALARTARTGALGGPPGSPPCSPCARPAPTPRSAGPWNASPCSPPPRPPCPSRTTGPRPPGPSTSTRPNTPRNPPPATPCCAGTTPPTPCSAVPSSCTLPGAPGTA